MSTGTLTRQLTRPAGTRTSGYAGFAEPVRAVRPLAAPAPMRLDRTRLAPLGLDPVRSGPVAPPRPILPPPPPRARLTRRGRLVLLVLAAGTALAVISVGRAGSQAATATETGPALQQTTVQQGETLWMVAERIAPHNDPRDVIAQIRRINHLRTSGLRVGQQLLLPVPSR